MSSSGERRTEIIHAVWQVIAEQGMGAVTMRSVAAAAGVSVGRIQYWFGSKEEMVHAGLVAMLAGAEAGYRHSVSDADPGRALWELLSHPIPRIDAARVGVSVFHQYAAAAINDPELARLLTEAKAGEEREVARLLVRIVGQVEHPLVTARALVATADGLALRVLIGSISAATAERALRVTLDRALA